MVKLTSKQERFLEEYLIKFTSNKLLTKDKYLKIFIKEDEAKSYEEVQENELLDKVKSIYRIK